MRVADSEIAHTLYVSPATMRTRVSRAMIKLGGRAGHGLSSWPAKRAWRAPTGLPDPLANAATNAP